MAKAKNSTGTGSAQVSVSVPQEANIKVTNLKGKSDQEVAALLAKVKQSRVGFIILNAPFKVQPVK